MFIEKIKLAWVKNRILRVTVNVASMIILAFLFYRFVSSYYERVSELTKGVLGTVIGAVTGGFFTLSGSIVINNKMQKNSSAIRKKNTIYKPLYDELMDIHSKILVDNPYPHYIVFEKGPQTELNHPQYTVWGRIKSDSRYLEVPTKLKKTMESLYVAIEDYLYKRRIAVSSLERIYKEELAKLSIDSSNALLNSGTTLLDEILSGVKSDNSFLFRRIKSDDERELVSHIWNSLHDRIVVDEAYNQLLESKSIWKTREETALEYLAFLISYISEKYEG